MVQGGPRRRNIFILAGFGVLAVLVVAGYLLAGLLATGRNDQARRGWEARLGTWDEIIRQYPSTEANRAALELELLAQPLGLDMIPRSADRERPKRAVHMAYRRVRKNVGHYVKTQLPRAERQLDAPSEKLLAFFDAHDETLDAIRRHLRSGDVPDWGLQLERLADAPIPNLLGLIDLHKLLIADALVRSFRGDRAGALADIDASWRLNLALRDDPIVITQLIAISVARMQAAALRQIDDVPAEWAERLLDHEFRQSFLTALNWEGYVWTNLPDPASDPHASLSDRIIGKLARPYLQFSLASLTDTFRYRLANLAALDVLCDRDLARVEADLEIPVAPWNLVAKAAMPMFGGAVSRLARLEIDLELTSKLIELEAARRFNGGRWPAPADLDGIERSRSCPDDRWVYRAEPAGPMTLAFERELSWKDHTSLMLPTRLTR